jgi:hypothetical protein
LDNSLSLLRGVVMKIVSNKIDNPVNRIVIYGSRRRFAIESISECTSANCQGKCLLSKKKANLHEVDGGKFTHICMTTSEWRWE